MKHIKNSHAVFVGPLLTIVAVVFFVPALAHGQKSTEPASPTADVRVVNTTAEPVPITGTINVGNPGGNPLPVRDVDNPTRQPVHFRNSFTVPAGKGLVIEYISAKVRFVGPCQFVSIELASIPPGRLHYFFPTFVGTLPTPTGPAEYIYGLSQETRAYVDENRPAILSLITSGGCDLNTEFKYASGYLVDKQ